MEQIVRKCFKKLYKSGKIEDIIANVQAVISDHTKPSFLFDVCACDRKILSNFIVEINSSNFGTKVHLLCIDECHYFIANINAVQEAIDNAMNDKIVFIDIGKEKSKTLTKVSEFPNLKNMLIYTINNLQSSAQCVILSACKNFKKYIPT